MVKVINSCNKNESQIISLPSFRSQRVWILKSWTAFVRLWKVERCIFFNLLPSVLTAICFEKLLSDLRARNICYSANHWNFCSSCLGNTVICCRRTWRYLEQKFSWKWKLNRIKPYISTILMRKWRKMVSKSFDPSERFISLCQVNDPMHYLCSKLQF